MGQSYGSLLGVTYAAMFPTHVRAMVLDGVIDPALSFDQFTQQQADGFETLLDAFLGWCAGTTRCPWRPAGDPSTALLGMLSAAVTAPVPAGGGRQAGAGELFDALLDGLYSRNDWPQLGAALAADAAGNGAGVVAMSDRYNDAGSPNQDDAEVAVDCLDHPVSRQIATTVPWPGPSGRRPRLRALVGLGRGGLRGVAGAADPDAGAGFGHRCAAHPGRRDHERPGHALRLGGERGPRAQSGCPARPRDGDDHVAYFYSRLRP